MDKKALTIRIATDLNPAPNKHRIGGDHLDKACLRYADKVLIGLLVIIHLLLSISELT
jgi:hypothetical protein